MASPFIGTYTSFSGSDLVVSFGPTVIGELQQISYAVQREKVPVFTLGSPNPRSFSRGKRGIAGSLVFAAFDRDALLEEMKNIWEIIAPKAMFTAAGNIAVGKSEDFSKAMELTRWNQAATAINLSNYQDQSAIDKIIKELKPEEITAALAGIAIGVSIVGIVFTVGMTVGQILLAITAGAAGAAALVAYGGTDKLTTDIGNALKAYAISKTSGAFGISGGTDVTLQETGKQIASRGKDMIYAPPGFKTITRDNIQYVDQLPPFDITLTFANEYGQAAFQKFYDVEVLNEASGVSVDSVVMERNYTWVGRNLSPLYKGIYSREGEIIKQNNIEGVSFA